jgi:hypothetical protein
VPRAHVAPYEGHAIELFDDGIGAQAVGPGVEPTVSPGERDLVRERTHLGDCVVRTRVVSLTSAQDESGPSWFIGLHTVERLTGKRQVPDNFTLRIGGKGSCTFIWPATARTRSTPSGSQRSLGTSDSSEAQAP